MKEEIYYFSGTGNSLAIAKKIQDKLTDSKLRSIANIIKNEKIDIQTNIVIVSPIYMYNIPHIVRDFIKNLKGEGLCSFIFAGGGETGKSVKVIKKLFSGNKIILNSIFNIPLPSNYAPYGASEKNEINRLFSEAESRIPDICEIIESEREHFDSCSVGFFKANIHPGIAYSMGYKYLNYLSKNYYYDNNCDGCGICGKVCPVNNIKMIDNKPEWEQNCQQCFACIQWCPKEAVQYGKKTVGIKRYHNPDITVKEIIDSNPF